MEDKAKFFCLYPVRLYKEAIVSDSKLVHQDSWNTNPAEVGLFDALILRNIRDISDDEIEIAIGHSLDGYVVTNVNENGFDHTNTSSLPVKTKQWHWKGVEYDRLRDLGYALPYLDETVDSMKDKNWFVWE